MRVSSPIGDLPFEAQQLRLSRRGLHIEGAMGAWPAYVHVEPSDLLAMARLPPWRSLAVALAAGLFLVRGSRRRQ